MVNTAADDDEAARQQQEETQLRVEEQQVAAGRAAVAMARARRTGRTSWYAWLRGVLDEVDTANWAATMCVVLAVYVFIPAGYLRKDRHPEGGIIDYMPGAHLSGPDVTGRPPP